MTGAETNAEGQAPAIFILVARTEIALHVGSTHRIVSVLVTSDVLFFNSVI
jgi:hypothetical protein